MDDDEETKRVYEWSSPKKSNGIWINACSDDCLEQYIQDATQTANADRIWCVDCEQLIYCFDKNDFIITPEGKVCAYCVK